MQHTNRVKATLAAIFAALAVAFVAFTATTVGEPTRAEQLVSEQGYVEHGQVSEETWQRLLDAGWQGHPGDRKEALYPPE